KGLSANTIKVLHAAIGQALHQAVRFGLLNRNVAELVDLPRARRYDAATLTAEQAKRLLAYAGEDDYEAFWLLALTTGLRPGEILALRWSDVDLQAGTLHVHGNVSKQEHGWAVAETKTRKSRRNVLLMGFVVEALQRHRVRQNELRLRVGPEWIDD